MKRLLFLCALTLSMLLLAGCVPAMVITSPRNAEFQEAWEDSIDESAEEWAGDWEAAWESAWDGIRTSRRGPGNRNRHRRGAGCGHRRPPQRRRTKLGPPPRPGRR